MELPHDTNDKLPLRVDSLSELAKNHLIGLHAATGQPIAELVTEILDAEAPEGGVNDRRMAHAQTK
jgi:hypothetical protein